MDPIDIKTLPKYRSHKVVRATRVTGIEPAEADGTSRVLTEHGSLRIKADQKPWPQVGGYLVAYEDGYVSFSPAKAFEDGYAEEPESYEPLSGQTSDIVTDAKRRS